MSCELMALSTTLRVPETQVFTRLTEDTYCPLCPTQLAQSQASQLNPLHWCMTRNGVTPILRNP